MPILNRKEIIRQLRTGREYVTTHTRKGTEKVHYPIEDNRGNLIGIDTYAKTDNGYHLNRRTFLKEGE